MLYRLSKFPAAKVVVGVRAQLIDPSPMVRAAAVTALGDLADPADAEVIKPLMYDESWNVRIAAARALAIQDESDDATTLFMKTLSTTTTTTSWHPEREKYDTSTSGPVWMWRHKLGADKRFAMLEPRPSLTRRLSNVMLTELLRTKDNPDFDPGFLLGLRFVRDKHINDVLLELAENPRKAVRMNAMTTLFISGDSRELDPYLAGNHLDEIDFPRLDKNRTLERMRSLLKLTQYSQPELHAQVAAQLVWFEHPLATQFLTDAARKPNGVFHSAGAWSLSPERVSCLLELLEKDINTVQVIPVLENVADPRAHAALLAGLKNVDPVRRQRFVAAMKSVSDAEILTTLIEMAKNDADRLVRIAALRALGTDRTNNAAALNTLLQALPSPDKDIRAGAASALAMGTHEIDDASVLMPYVNHPDAHTRLCMFGTLMISRDLRAVNWSATTGASLDGKTRAAVIDALARDSRVIPVMEKLLADPESLVRRAALNALIQQDAPRKFELIAPLGKAADPFVRVGALGMIAGTDVPAEIQWIAAALDDPHADVRLAAAKILVETHAHLGALDVKPERIEKVLKEAKIGTSVKPPAAQPNEF